MATMTTRSLLITAIACSLSFGAAGMSARLPKGKVYKGWEVFVLPQAGGVEFAVFYAHGRTKYRYDVEDPAKRVHSIEEMEQRLADIPRTDWISIQYFDAPLPEEAATTVRTRLESACKTHRRRCVFAL